MNKIKLNQAGNFLKKVDIDTLCVFEQQLSGYEEETAGAAVYKKMLTIIPIITKYTNVFDSLVQKYMGNFDPPAVFLHIEDKGYFRMIQETPQLEPVAEKLKQKVRQYLDSVHKTPNTTLLRAAQECHMAELAAAIMAGADLEVRNDEGHTALMIAANNGDAEAVRALSSVGADLTVVDSQGFTARMKAEHNRDSKMFSPDAKARFNKIVQILSKEENTRRQMSGAVINITWHRALPAQLSSSILDLAPSILRYTDGIYRPKKWTTHKDISLEK